MWTVLLHTTAEDNVLGADKDKVPCDQTLRNNNKDAISNCKGGFHQSEDKCNCHFHVTSITTITFTMCEVDSIMTPAEHL